MVRRLVIVLAAWLSWAPALAQDAVPCETMLGDFWGERPAPANVRTVDGASITSPAELVRAVGDGAIVLGGNFAEWDFRRITLMHACFVETSLKGSVWNGARTPGIGFIKTDLSEASLVGIAAPGVLFRDANLTNVKASKADFSGGLLEGGWFEGAIDGWNLDGADLSRFTFSCGITLSDGCPLQNTATPLSARGANFSGARLSSFRRYGLDDIDLDGALLDRTEISPAQLGSLKGRMILHPLILVGADSRIELGASEAQALVDDAAIVASGAAGPSFDCARASSPTEKALCLPDAVDLAQADRDLATLYAEVRPSHPAVGVGQRQWLKTRDACMAQPYPSDCLRAAYADRQGVLLGLLGERDWLAPGTGAVFIDDELPLSDAMRASPLFARLAPLLAKASMAYVHVARAADGTYAVSGEAVGANAHSCSLGATELRLDPATGWYSLSDPSTKARVRIIQIRGDMLSVLGNGHPDGEQADASVEYVSCGVRAAFGAMRRIALPAAVLNSYAARATMEP